MKSFATANPMTEVTAEAKQTFNLQDFPVKIRLNFYFSCISMGKPL